MTEVYLEVGKRRVFACAPQWPGWCRPGRAEEPAPALDGEPGTAQQTERLVTLQDKSD